MSKRAIILTILVALIGLGLTFVGWGKPMFIPEYMQPWFFVSGLVLLGGCLISIPLTIFWSRIGNWVCNLISRKCTTLLRERESHRETERKLSQMRNDLECITTKILPLESVTKELHISETIVKPFLRLKITLGNCIRSPVEFKILDSEIKCNGWTLGGTPTLNVSIIETSETPLSNYIITIDQPISRQVADELAKIPENIVTVNCDLRLGALFTREHIQSQVRYSFAV